VSSLLQANQNLPIDVIQILLLSYYYTQDYTILKRLHP